VSLQTVGRMVIAPAVVAVAVGLLLRPPGSAAFLLAFASFFAAQLAVGVQSRRQLEDAKRRLATSRARRRRRRLQRRA
jgi:hypothetical protein